MNIFMCGRMKVEKAPLRTRAEWSESEEATLLQGLLAHGPDFEVFNALSRSGYTCARVCVRACVRVCM